MNGRTVTGSKLYKLIKWQSEWLGDYIFDYLASCSNFEIINQQSTLFNLLCFDASKSPNYDNYSIYLKDKLVFFVNTK